MIDFYYWPTPNGWKVSIMLEECGLDYEVCPVNIGCGEQLRPEFLAISPNGRIPALVDHGADGDDLRIFESGTILIYLAEKTSWLMPADQCRRFEVLQWVFWQTSGLGPIAGQLGHFVNCSEADIDYSVERFEQEYSRLLGVLDHQLEERDYLCGDYSIADIACWPSVRSHAHLGQPLDEFPHLKRWFSMVAARPAVQKGIKVGAELWGSRKTGD